MSQGFNKHTNGGRPNTHPLQSGADTLTSPTSGPTPSSYIFTLKTSITSASPPGTNERQLADDSQAEVELILSTTEEMIRRTETRVCALYNLNQQEKEGRKILQEKCRELEVAVRDREDEVATLKHRLEKSEQDKERVMQELAMRNPRRRTEYDIANLAHVAEERMETNHDVHERSGRHVQARPGPSQVLPPPMGQNTDPRSSMKQPPLRQQTAPNFIGGFAWNLKS